MRHAEIDFIVRPQYVHYYLLVANLRDLHDAEVAARRAVQSREET